MDNDVQEVSYARRYVEAIPGVDLVEVNGQHIPTEDFPAAIAKAILNHLAD